MAVVTPPFVQQGGTHPASTFRQALQGLVGSPFGSFAGGISATSGGGGHGVVGASDLLVTQNGTPNMSVNVAGGSYFIRGTESAAQGVYSSYNDATVNLAVATSDPTNPRKDLVVMRVRDAFYSGAFSDDGLAVVTGTAAFTPADPVVPANCLVLARVTVAAGVTSVTNANITDLRTYAYALGGVVVCTSTTRPSGASLRPGLVVFEQNTQNMYVVGSDGVTFQKPWNRPWGVMGYATTSTNQTGVGATAVALTGLTTPSVTYVAGRLLRATARLFVNQLTASGSQAFGLVRAGSLFQYNGQGAAAAAGSYADINAVWMATSVAGAQTFGLQALTSAGTMTITNAGAAGWVMIEDVGPA